MPFGVLGVGDGSQPEEHELELARHAERLQQLGEEGEREAGLDRAFDGARAERHDEHEPEQPEERDEVRGVVRLLLVAA